jgi:homoserine kinase
VSWPEQPVVVRAPATSANLGPGFDSLGLALTLHDVIEVRVTGGGLGVRVTGEGGEAARHGERHLVVRALRAGFDALGGQPPGIQLSCQNEIPHGRGLGSSAAAIVSGLLAARELAGGGGRLTDEELFRLAAEMEGHPDNVAACLAGGLTIAWTPGTGAGGIGAARADAGGAGAAGPRLLALPVTDDLLPVACVPAERLATKTARGVLPATVPHADAAANSGRAALLIAALTREPDVLFDATEDYLHQRYRAGVLPQAADLLGRLRGAGVAAVVSGAGPAVLALLTAGRPPERTAVDSIARETGIAWRVIPLKIDRHGAVVQHRWAGARSPEIPRSVRPEGRAHHPGRSPADTSPQDNAASAVKYGRP